MLVLFSLLSFLPPASALVYIKIASLKYNTHLGKDDGNNLVVVSQGMATRIRTGLGLWHEGYGHFVSLIVCDCEVIHQPFIFQIRRQPTRPGSSPGLTYPR